MDRRCHRFVLILLRKLLMIQRFSPLQVAICDLPPVLLGGKARWLVLYDAPGADRKEGEHTVFGDLLRHD